MVATEPEKTATHVHLLARCLLCESRDISPLFPKLEVWKCQSCGMMFRNPPPGEDRLRGFYEDAFHPQNVRSHKTGMEGTTRWLAQQYVSHLDRRVGIAGKRVLEFGAGLGIASQVLRDKGAIVTAIEPFAWSECSKTGIRTYRSLDELPDCELFDAAVALEVLEHLPSPWLILRQLRNFLKVGGWLYVATPNAAGLRARLHGERWREFLRYGHLLFYTPQTLELALKKAGYGRFYRVRDTVRYSKERGRALAQYILHSTGLEGDLRYLAQRT